MIGPPTGVRIWLACGVTDLRNGFDGLAALVQTQLSEHAYSGQVFAFRGRRRDRTTISIPIELCRCQISMAPTVWQAGKVVSTHRPRR